MRLSWTALIPPFGYKEKILNSKEMILNDVLKDYGLIETDGEITECQ